jgi:hypothetical protein
MSSRKIAPGNGNSNGPTIGQAGQPLAPRTAVKTPVVTAEYAEALKVLNDETMSQACSLLLSEKDYEAEPAAADGKSSDYEELLALYAKCRNAAAVIKREAPAELLSVPTMPAPARAQAKPLGKATVGSKSMNMVGTKNIMIPSNRRMARLPASAMGNKRPLLQHETSDSSLEAQQQRASNTKKSRMSPPPPPHREGSAPPPSALNFLAKLNKDKDTEKKEKEANEKADAKKEKELKEKAEAKAEARAMEKEKKEIADKEVQEKRELRERREVKKKEETVEKQVVKGRIQPPRASRK